MLLLTVICCYPNFRARHHPNFNQIHVLLLAVSVHCSSKIFFLSSMKSQSIFFNIICNFDHHINMYVIYHCLQSILFTHYCRYLFVQTTIYIVHHYTYTIVYCIHLCELYAYHCVCTIIEQSLLYSSLCAPVYAMYLDTSLNT